MIEDVIELCGAEEGATSMVLAGVHGDERCGVEALEDLLPTLRIRKGRVFIAYGNPQAIKENVRFTTANLNRMFKPKETLTSVELGSYEYERAGFLKTYLDRADALLDVHASFTPESRSFIICESNAISIASYLPFQFVVSGFDRIEPGGTDYYMNSIGKVGICAECGYLGDPFSKEIAKKSILDFLTIQGHLDGDIESRKQEYIAVYSRYCSVTDFRLAKPFSDFEEVVSGQLIGIDAGKEIRAPKNGVILFARDIDTAGEEAFLLGEYKRDPA